MIINSFVTHSDSYNIPISSTTGLKKKKKWAYYLFSVLTFELFCILH